MINSFIPPPEGTFVVDPTTGLELTSIYNPNSCTFCEYDDNATACSRTECSKNGVIVIEKNRYLTLKMTGELDGIRGS